jgi:hypothetical protein
MPVSRDDLHFSIRYGLTVALQHIRGARRVFTEEERDRIAGHIADHLLSTNHIITKGSPAPGHGAGWHFLPPKD